MNVIQPFEIIVPTSYLYEKTSKLLETQRYCLDLALRNENTIKKKQNTI